MAKVFVSYRRADNAAGYANDLARSLRQTFGERHVFRDVHSIPPGVDFGEFIRQALKRCTVMLVVIGRHWTTETTEDGRRRLFEPNDWVRIEVATALAAPHVRVIPVLVGGATLPRADQLPPDLQLLVNRNAVSLEDRKWESDIASLLADLEQVPGLRDWWERFRRQPVGKATDTKSRLGRRLGIGTAAVVGVLVAFLIFQAFISFVENVVEGCIDYDLDVTLADVVTCIEGGRRPWPPPTAHIDVSGFWVDREGNTWQLILNQNNVSLQVHGELGHLEGRGFLKTRTVEFEFSGGGHRATGMLTVAADGRSMEGWIWTSLTAVTEQIYLRRP